MGALVWSAEARATTARAISLQDLVSRSTRVLRGTPVDSFARSEAIGGVQHIVTYSRLRIEEAVLGEAREPEALVRTLGGRLSDVGEIVHGEAELAINESCLVFLRTDSEGVELVTAMAQGHYPIAADAQGTPRLQASRNMPHLLRNASSSAAVAQLQGLRFEEARSLISGVRP